MNSLALTRRSWRPLPCAIRFSTSRTQLASVVGTPKIINEAQAPDSVSQTKLAEATMKRFWKAVEIKENDMGYTVTLDSKPLKTPSSAVLQIPSSKRTLATLIAAEWSQVSSASIRQHQLPLTSLAARAIDHLDLHHTDRMATISTLLRYLDTDAILIHAPGPAKFLDMQESEWTPIRDWASKFFKSEINWQPHDAGLIGNKQSEQTQQAAREYLETLDKWDLAAFERSVYTTKSFILSTLLIESQKQGLLDVSGEKGEGALGVEKIANLATLEVRYQVQNWGEVEDTHDVDHVDIRRQLASAVILVKN